jgi:Ethanolamine utilization protein EutJ (predicted chaperonin)
MTNKSETGFGQYCRNAATDEDKNNSEVVMKIERLQEPFRMGDDIITHVIKDSEETDLFYIGAHCFYDEFFRPVTENQERKIASHRVFERWVNKLANNYGRA